MRWDQHEIEHLRLGLRRFVVTFVLGMAWCLGGLLIAPASYAQEPGHDFVEGEVIVKLKKDVAGGPGAQADAFVSRFQRDGGRVKRSFSKLRMHHISKRNRRTRDLIAELQNDPAVEYVEPNYIIYKDTYGQLTPGPVDELPQEIVDPNAQSLAIQGQSVGSQSVGTMSSNSFFLTGTDIMDAVTAWPILSSTTTKPIVAIIDTGVKMTHPALSNAIWVNPGETGLDGSGNSKSSNGIDDDGNGYVDDVNGWNFQQGNNNPTDCDGHGTHVAGIVRGMTQNLSTASGATPLIQIMPVRFLDCNGSGTTSAAISAIYYAIQNGAKVLNNSWGGGGYSQALNEAIAASYNSSTIFVAAAGNSTSNNDNSPMYPATYDVPNIVSVASTDSSDALSWYSNYGASTVHIAATGESVYSTYIGASATGNYYTTLSGTSMAAPMVSGLAALILRERPSMTGYQAKQIILSKGTYVSGLSGRVATSSRIQAHDSVLYAQTATLLSSVPSYSMTLSAGNRSVASAIASSGAGCGLVTKLSDKGTGDGPGNYPPGLMIFSLFALPLIVTVLLRRFSRETGEARRKYDRFTMKSSLKLKIGGRELEGQVVTISQGGAGISTEALLEQGSIVTMTIQSPDGREKIQVDGHVVWSDPSQGYGVQFDDATSSLRETIAKWTLGLIKSS